jgi:hypothetical protein
MILTNTDWVLYGLAVYVAEQLDLSSNATPLSVPPRVSFHPSMTHQLFGDDEIIRGYKNLKVRLFVSVC